MNKTADAPTNIRQLFMDNVKNPNFEYVMEGDEVTFIEETVAEKTQAKRVRVG